jgi:hypothetical protein
MRSSKFSDKQILANLWQAEASMRLSRFVVQNDERRPHSSLGDRTPDETSIAALCSVETTAQMSADQPSQRHLALRS